MRDLTKSLRIKAATGAFLGGTLALAACGSATSTPADPQVAIHQSLAGLTSQSGVTIRVSLGITAAQAQQLAALGSSPSHLTAQQAQALTTGSVFLDVSTGHGEALDSKQAATDQSDNYDFGLRIGKDTPVELRVIDQNVYARLVASQLITDTGANLGSLSKLQTEAATINADVPGVSALAAGQWVEISHSALAPLLALAKSMEASSGTAAGSASNTLQYKSEYTQLVKDLSSALKTNSTTTSVGSTGGRHEYSVVVQVKALLAQVGTALRTDLASLPGGIGSRYSQGLSSATAKIKAGQTVVLDVYTQSNRLEEVDIDLNQFATGSDHAPFAVPLRLVFATNPTISAPSGATQIDLSKIPSLLQGLARSGGSSSASTSATYSG